MDELFSVFDDDSDDEEENNVKQEKTQQQQRDASCGVLAFHQNTESSMLIHVQNYLSSNGGGDTSHNVNDDSVIKDPKVVLEAIDDFSFHRHWMMHIGPEKTGIILENGLEPAFKNFVQSNNTVSTTAQKKNKFIAVEMGTYCGYSSICIGQKLKEILRIHREGEEVNKSTATTDNNNENGVMLDAHLYTFEVNPKFHRIATKMIELSGLEDMITSVLLPLPSSDHDNSIAEKLILETLKGLGQIHFLFLDHDKDMYKESFQFFHGFPPACASSSSFSFLKRGSVVVADNVVFANIQDYMSYIKELASKCSTTEPKITTRTIMSRVEYWTQQELDQVGKDTLQDGIGK